ncbi:SecA DEAD-like domain-containing protein [Pelagophyceae sp. CCMP2097]|nr:SecA DEAD-like domain-containing protein [Pelagophyceae sp. CCMP2097]
MAARAPPRVRMLCLALLSAAARGLALRPAVSARARVFSRRAPVRSMWGGFELPGPLNQLLGNDAATMKREPGWLAKVGEVKRYAKRVAAIEALGPEMAALADADLAAKTGIFRARLAKGETLDDLLVEAFAVCREAAKRSLGQYHYDVQLVGGIALHEGKLAEMATGEGKTLVATLPLYLRALGGGGAHLVTVNDYLARRDAEALGPLYTYLGLTVGVVQGGSTPAERGVAYGSDVTYVTNNELGFDYLRDNLCFDAADVSVTRRGLNFAIVDEADSILIDEARTPLIISGEDDNDAPKKYEAATEVVKFLQNKKDYEIDAKAKRVYLTDAGYLKTCDLLGVAGDPDGLYGRQSRWAAYVNPALCAKELYIRERDYIVDKAGEVKIVDEFTGRIMDGRRWNNGLHQAVEAKERVKVRPEQRTVASISYQSLFKLYDSLSGMTGTAYTEKIELEALYGLDVLRVPTFRRLLRLDDPDLVFATKLAKFRSVRARVQELHDAGRPVLVGTTSIEDSALVSELLSNDGIKHRVLNAKPDVAERESEIISQAGRVKAVTIATNMAGRGTDILLGGNAELVARLRVRQSLVPLVDADLAAQSRVSVELLPKPELSPDVDADLEAACRAAAKELRLELGLELPGDRAFKEGQGFDVSTEIAKPTARAVLDAVDELIASAAAMSAARSFSAVFNGAEAPRTAKELVGAAFDAVKAEYAAVVDAERAQVRQLGGLFVLGTERHESRRIDKQLRGRSGRQGDAGESVFAISLEDKIFNVFDGEKMGQLRLMFNMFDDADAPLSSDMLTKSLSTIQEKVESFYEEVRTNLVSYDRVVDSQRRVFYARRAAVLGATRPGLEKLLDGYISDTVADVVANYTRGDDSPVDAANGAMKQLRRMFPGANEAFDDVANGLDVEDAAQVAGIPAALGEAARKGLRLQIGRIQVKGEEGGDPNLATAVLRFLVLREFDKGWKDYIADLEILRSDIGYVAFKQRDPFQEWTIKSNDLFQKLSADIYRFAAIQALSLDPQDLVVTEPSRPQPQDASQAAPPALPGAPQQAEVAAAAQQRAALDPKDNRASRRSTQKKKSRLS